jgi:hypothetical protein
MDNETLVRQCAYLSTLRFPDATGHSFGRLSYPDFHLLNEYSRVYAELKYRLSDQFRDFDPVIARIKELPDIRARRRIDIIVEKIAATDEGMILLAVLSPFTMLWYLSLRWYVNATRHKVNNAHKTFSLIIQAIQTKSQTEQGQTSRP